MPIPYVVRKKADLTSGERKELWYGVPSRMQHPLKNRAFSEYMEKRSGFHRGQVNGILTEMVDAIQSLLSMGQAVTIEGLGTFQVSLTSEGCEYPEQVTPGKVKVSRICFTASPQLRREMRKVKGRRIPFHSYMPESVLTEAMKRADRKQERVEYGLEPPEPEEESGE